MKKEITLFMGIFLFLAIRMHFEEWLDHPLEHITTLPNAGAFGFGAFHPLIFTLIVYIIFIIFRAFIRLFTKKR